MIIGKFSLGKTIATARISTSGLDVMPYLNRHIQGDWGNIDEHDKKENNWSLKNNFRLFSVYNTPVGTIYIITEADRLMTTIMFPSDY